MSKISLHIMNANHTISAEQIATARAAFRRAVRVSKQLLNINFGVDVVLLDRPWSVIPEDGISGRTETKNFIKIFIDPSKDISEEAFSTTFCHEFNHARRYDLLPDYDYRLAAAIISEGLATAYEEEVSTKPGFFLSTIQQRRNSDHLYQKLKSVMSDKKWDHQKLFIAGDKNTGLPRWTGYQVGYYLVKVRMKQTGLPASKLIGEPVDNFVI